MEIPEFSAHQLELEMFYELLEYHEEAALYGLSLLDMKVMP